MFGLGSFRRRYSRPGLHPQHPESGIRRFCDVTMRHKLATGPVCAGVVAHLENDRGRKSIESGFALNCFAEGLELVF